MFKHKNTKGQIKMLNNQRSMLKAWGFNYILKTDCQSFKYSKAYYDVQNNLSAQL